MELNNLFIAVAMFTLLSTNAQRRLVNYSECNKFKTEDEKRVSYASDGGNGWCNVGNTVYTNCMCEKDKEEKRLNNEIKTLEKEFAEVREFNNNIKANAQIEFNKAHSIRYKLNPHSYEMREQEFNSLKTQMLVYYDDAITRIRSASYPYAICVRLVELKALNADCVKKGGFYFPEKVESFENERNSAQKLSYTHQVELTLGDETTNRESEIEQRNKSNEEYEKRNKEPKPKSSQKEYSVYDSYNEGMQTAQNMRDKANNMVVRFRFEQDYKNNLISRANDLERNLVKPQQFILSGMDGNTLSTYYSTPAYSSSQITIQAVSSAVSSFLNELERQKAEKQMKRRREVNRERTRIGKIYQYYKNNKKKLDADFEKYKNNTIGYNSLITSVNSNISFLKDYINYNNRFSENDIESNSTTLFKYLNDLKEFAFFKELNNFEFVDNAIKFVYQNEQVYEILSVQNKKDIDGLISKGLINFKDESLVALFISTTNEELLLKLLEAGVNANNKEFLVKINKSTKIKNYLKNYYIGERITVLENNSNNLLRLAQDIKTLLYGYVDKFDKWKIEPNFLIAKPFANGKAVVAKEKVGLDFIYYTIDKKNKLIKNVGNDIIVLTDFHEGFAVAIKKDGRLKGYINQNFEWVVKPKYIKASNVSQGKAEIKTLSGKTKTITLK
jgi:hypothetical protein